MNNCNQSAEVLNGIVNKIGHFNINVSDAEYACVGVIEQEKGRVLLQCELPIDVAEKVYHFEQPFKILGYVSNTPITLYKPHVDSYQTQGFNPINALVFFSANYLIVGYAEKTDIRVHDISLSSSDINWFFSRHPISHDNRTDREIIENLDSIETSDNVGKIKIHQSLAEGMSNKSLHINIFTVLSCDFNTCVDLDSAINRLASLRNMMSFFFDGYIPLDNICISDKKEPKTIEEYAEYTEYTIVNTHPEKPSSQDKPFFINADIIRDCFNQVWKNWTDLYTQARPMTALFYGIISGVSSGLNEYLNMAQALEVYSNRYRTEQIRKAYNKTKKEKVFLSERLKDLIDSYNNHLGVLDAGALAQKLSDIRNYYTHYNSRKFKQEPKYDVVLSGSYILRSLLLLVVYSELGIPSDKLSKAKELGFIRDFDAYCDVVIGNKL